jgi:cell division septation protein DedD
MGLKRRNPARSRLLTAPEMVAGNAPPPAPAANQQATKKVARVETKPAAPPAVPGTTASSTAGGSTTGGSTTASSATANSATASSTAASSATTSSAAANSAAAGPSITRAERQRRIAEAAYGYAVQSGFATDPVQNWLAAEREIDAQLSRLAS